MIDVEKFIDNQLKTWPMAAGNFDALRGVEVKELEVDGMPVKVQFNPARAVSSGAKVDAASIKARKCFLCAENRPAEQFGEQWRGGAGNEYTILVNPFPIFPRHLTIPDPRHTDQLIGGRMADMIRLARELNGYTVFYNGPRCGASAPDHMHFQAGNSDFLTLADALDNAELEPLASENASTLFAVDSLPLKLFVIDAANPEEGEALFDKLYRQMPVAEGEAEPMMNILCWADGEKTRVAVIPRKRHRPSFYGTEGDDCMMLSPASVDLGGVFITPRRVDYDRMTPEVVGQIYKELCLSSEELKEISNRVKGI